MKTWLQTVDVHFKNSSKVYHTLELAPVPKGGLCSYIKDDVVYSDSVKKIVLKIIQNVFFVKIFQGIIL